MSVFQKKTKSVAQGFEYCTSINLGDSWETETEVTDAMIS